MAEPTKEMVEEEAPGGDDVEVILNEPPRSGWIVMGRGEGDQSLS
jgi:hypothetical protein